MLSTLHRWIRVFQYILYLGYKTKIKNFQARLEEPVNYSAKKEIQNRFQNELSLKVDNPKQGFSNTNLGNTVRRAFKNA